MGKLKKQSHVKDNSTSRKASAGEQRTVAVADEIALERRAQDRRKGFDRRNQSIPVAAERRKTERRKTPRRRQIDPTTCERDYSAEEIEFMAAMDAYKRASGRMFPTCSEVLEVLRGLGYEKRPQTTEPLASPTVEAAPIAQTAT